MKLVCLNTCHIKRLLISSLFSNSQDLPPRCCTGGFILKVCQTLPVCRSLAVTQVSRSDKRSHHVWCFVDLQVNEKKRKTHPTVYLVYWIISHTAETETHCIRNIQMGVGRELKDRLLQAKVKGFKKQSCIWAVEGAGGSKRCWRWDFNFTTTGWKRPGRTQRQQLSSLPGLCIYYISSYEQ